MKKNVLFVGSKLCYLAVIFTYPWGFNLVAQKVSAGEGMIWGGVAIGWMLAMGILLAGSQRLAQGCPNSLRVIVNLLIAAIMLGFEVVGYFHFGWFYTATFVGAAVNLMDLALDTQLFFKERRL